MAQWSLLYREEYQYQALKCSNRALMHKTRYLGGTIIDTEKVSSTEICCHLNLNIVVKVVPGGKRK